METACCNKSRDHKMTRGRTTNGLLSNTHTPLEKNTLSTSQRKGIKSLFASKYFISAPYDSTRKVRHYTIHDKRYYNSRHVLQFTTSVITIHDMYHNSRQYM